jgi:hypothetical protein
VIKAYALVQANPGKTGSVVKLLTQVKEVISAEGVGPYDVVAVAEADNLEELSGRVIGSIQAIDKVSIGHPSPWSTPGAMACWWSCWSWWWRPIGEAMKEVRR